MFYPKLTPFIAISEKNSTAPHQSISSGAEVLVKNKAPVEVLWGEGVGWGAVAFLIKFYQKKTELKVSYRQEASERITTAGVHQPFSLRGPAKAPTPASAEGASLIVRSN